MPAWEYIHAAMCWPLLMPRLVKQCTDLDLAVDQDQDTSSFSSISDESGSEAEDMQSSDTSDGRLSDTAMKDEGSESHGVRIPVLATSSNKPVLRCLRTAALFL